MMPSKSEWPAPIEDGDSNEVCCAKMVLNLDWHLTNVLDSDELLEMLELAKTFASEVLDARE